MSLPEFTKLQRQGPYVSTQIPTTLSYSCIGGFGGWLEVSSSGSLEVPLANRRPQSLPCPTRPPLHPPLHPQSSFQLIGFRPRGGIGGRRCSLRQTLLPDPPWGSAIRPSVPIAVPRPPNSNLIRKVAGSWQTSKDGVFTITDRMYSSMQCRSRVPGDATWLSVLAAILAEVVYARVPSERTALSSTRHHNTSSDHYGE